MLNGHCSSAKPAAARTAVLFLLAWVLAQRGDAPAPPKDSGRKAEAGAATRSVKGMRLKVSADGYVPAGAAGGSQGRYPGEGEGGPPRELG
jgi:hypothetical protein